MIRFISTKEYYDLELGSKEFYCGRIFTDTDVIHYSCDSMEDDISIWEEYFEEDATPESIRNYVKLYNRKQLLGTL
jgi:hypothetical protein